MALNVTFNGVVYIIPETGEVGWGGNLDSYFVAIAAGALQKTGGNFTLSAETDFGPSYGLKSLYYKSRNSNPASSGIIRLNNNSDAVSWRNAANSTDLPLTVDASDRLSYNGSPVLTGTSPSAYVSSITGTANQVNASASTGAVTLSLPQSINTSANVQFGTEGLGSSTVASSILSLTSTSLGFLPPRMTTTQRDAISSPATGLFVYNTSTGVNNYYNGTSWVAIAAGGTINSGTQYQLGYYSATGTTISGLSSVTTNATGDLVVTNPGGAGTETIRFSTNSGLYTAGTNSLRTAIAGVERFSIDATSSNSAGPVYIAPIINQIRLGTTNTTTINATAPASSSIYTIPDVGTTANFVLTEGTQTINGLKTLGNKLTTIDGTAGTSAIQFGIHSGLYNAGTDSLRIQIAGTERFSVDTTNTNSAGAVLIAATTNQIKLGTTNTLTLTSPAPASSSTYTIPDVGTTASFVMTEGTQTINGAKTFGNNTTHTGTILNSSGTSSLPSYAFSSSSATGLYYPAANTIGFVTNATDWWELGSTGTLAATNGTGANKILTGDGTVSLPGLSFSADTDTGVYRIGTNNMGFAANGAKVFEIGSGSWTANTALSMNSNKITSLSNGTASADAVAFNQLKVIQVVTATSTTAFSSTSSTFQTTNCSASITPTSSSNKILILATASAGTSNAANSNCYVSIFRDSTNLGGGSDSAILRIRGNSGVLNVGGTMAYTDSPASTSAITYSVKIANDDNTTAIQYNVAGKSSITLIEVA